MTRSATIVTLASKSAVRAQLLAAAGVTFETASAGVDEEAIKTGLVARGAFPPEVASVLADTKALAIATSGIVLGADQTLDFHGHLMDKAETVAEARDRLKTLRGKSHRLHSAIAAAVDGEVVWRDLVSATLHMRSFSDAWLDAYLERNGDQVLSSVGCYQLEGEGVQLFDRVEGDYFAVLGLPLIHLLEFLRRRGALAS